MWVIYLEYITSVCWAYSMAFVIGMWLVGLVFPMPERWQVSLMPGWHGVLIGSTCLMQVLVAMMLDRSYDRPMLRHFYWMIWYPLAYWMLNMATTIVAVPKSLLRHAGKRAIWISPDRGVRAPETGLEDAALLPSAKQPGARTAATTALETTSEH